MLFIFFPILLFIGSPETNVDTNENRHDFIEKLQRLKQQLIYGIERGSNDEHIQSIDGEQRQIITARTIFTSDRTNGRPLIVGNWTLECNGSTQLRIHNVEGDQVSINCYLFSSLVFFSSCYCFLIKINISISFLQEDPFETLIIYKTNNIS